MTADRAFRRARAERQGNTRPACADAPAACNTIAAVTHRTRVIPRSHRPSRASAAARTLSLVAVTACAALGVFAAPALAKGSYLAGDRSLASYYAGVEGAKLGLSLPGGAAKFITITESPDRHLTLTLPDGTVGDADGDTDCRDATGDFVGAAAHCEIVIARGTHEVGAGELHATIAHEVFHVFQALMSGTLANFNRPGDAWLVEGSATWVESVLVHDAPAAYQWWGTYLDSPSVSLLNRTYSAVGFFGHLASSGISPWARFRAMFAATSNAAAYSAATGGDTSLISSEASVFFREPALGAEWDQEGTNVPSAAAVGFKPTPEDIKDHEELLNVAPYADGAYRLSLKKMKPAKPCWKCASPAPTCACARSTAATSTRSNRARSTSARSRTAAAVRARDRTKVEQFKEGNLAIAGGPTGGHVFLIPRTRCETLLAPRSCEGLLPGFNIPIAPTLEQATGTKLAQESSNPAIGYYTSICFFPVGKGETVENASGESVLDGASAILTYVKRFGKISEAEREFHIPPALPSGSAGTGFAGGGSTDGPVAGIGDEAAIASAEETNEKGETAFASEAIVRVRNVIAGFTIFSTGGDAEASADGTRILLSQVADEL